MRRLIAGPLLLLLLLRVAAVAATAASDAAGRCSLLAGGCIGGGLGCTCAWSSIRRRWVKIIWGCCLPVLQC